MRKKNELPEELIRLVTCLILNYKGLRVPPAINRAGLQLAVAHLNDGLWLRQEYYRICVSRPNDLALPKETIILSLVRAYPTGTMQFLSDIEG